MSSVALEAFLAKLYTDAAARNTFLADPVNVARDAGLSEADASSLREIDQAGLRLAAASYAHKREQHVRPKKKLHDFVLSWWNSRRTPQ